MTVTEQEIQSQPDIWRRALTDGALGRAAARTLAAPGERVLAIGCGTSWFVGQSYAELREAAGLGETDAACASEVAGRRRYDRVVAFSRSGTTTEVLAALDRLPAGTRTAAVVGSADTPIAQACTDQLVLDFADEQSIVQTRFPTTTLALARQAFGEPTGHLADAAEEALRLAPPAVAGIEHVVFLGSRWTVGLANEAALKVREAAQAWSEAYPVMDFRHGPMAVASARSLVWVFGPLPPGMADTAAATGAALHVDDLDPLAGLVLAQRFALALAARRGLDPDRPRLLTRSVILDESRT